MPGKSNLINEWMKTHELTVYVRDFMLPKSTYSPTNFICEKESCVLFPDYRMRPKSCDTVN